MTKPNKADYTKDQWRKLKEKIKQEKAAKRAAKANKLPPRPTIQNLNNNITSFVLGNGLSRHPVDLQVIKNYGKVYGCNAIYREYDPDYLIAVDVKMVLEINKHKYQLRNDQVWTNPNKAYNNMSKLNFFQPSKGWSSGPTALWLASQHGPQQIFILGFDYTGKDGGNHFNNIYADTENYKKSIDGATYHGNWLKQTATTIKEHPRINYTRVIAIDNYSPDELNILSNYNTMEMQHFLKIFAI
tara:strand:+ start:464 stop:1192 length:729 start_codon:yes stop_codon:yes gene_type:complete